MVLEAGQARLSSFLYQKEHGKTLHALRRQEASLRLNNIKTCLLPERHAILLSLKPSLSEKWQLAIMRRGSETCMTVAAACLFGLAGAGKNRRQ